MQQATTELLSGASQTTLRGSLDLCSGAGADVPRPTPFDPRDFTTYLDPTQFLYAGNLPQLPKHTGEYDTGLDPDTHFEQCEWHDMYVGEHVFWQVENEFHKSGDVHHLGFPLSYDTIMDVMAGLYQMLRAANPSVSATEATTMIQARKLILSWREKVADTVQRLGGCEDPGLLRMCRIHRD